MALDPMVVGCDWQATLIVEPTAGRTPAEITAELGAGASVVVRLIDSDGAVAASSAASAITSAAERTIEVIFTPAELALVTPGPGYVLDVRVTTPAAKVRAVQVREKIEVRAFTVSV